MPPKKENIEASDDPARAFITVRYLDVLPSETEPASKTLCWKCNFCNVELAFSSWVRCRGHLCGNSVKALANGAKACTSVPPDVAAVFLKALDEQAQRKLDAQAVKRGLDIAAASKSAAPAKQQRSIQAAFQIGHICNVS